LRDFLFGLLLLLSEGVFQFAVHDEILTTLN
jgi:hypothetical protein